MSLNLKYKFIYCVKNIYNSFQWRYQQHEEAVAQSDLPPASEDDDNLLDTKSVISTMDLGDVDVQERTAGSEMNPLTDDGEEDSTPLLSIKFSPTIISSSTGHPLESVHPLHRARTVLDSGSGEMMSIQQKVWYGRLMILKCKWLIWLCSQPSWLRWRGNRQRCVNRWIGKESSGEQRTQISNWASNSCKPNVRISTFIPSAKPFYAHNNALL